MPNRLIRHLTLSSIIDKSTTKRNSQIGAYLVKGATISFIIDCSLSNDHDSEFDFDFSFSGKLEISYSNVSFMHSTPSSKICYLFCIYTLINKDNATICYMKRIYVFLKPFYRYKQNSY